MLPTVFSLFSRNEGLDRELISPVLAGHGFRLEHIVSNGAASPGGFWYDQDGNEWVALIQGAATLEFPDGSLHLRAGDCLLIEAHRRHRVSFTSPDAVWIALHVVDTGSSVESA